ncbi:GGDEF domain-containing protein [Pseudoduganella lutea]|uniref:diguanylate cyclase n=1 Tax=Pseudoduganella lutea TaxID=321985 RepID=A0A4P6L5Q5_9BURK|nr:GGDEF domain-containing protein [Pseudoduganella lutea]QBE66794.1 GGDEF domain-containing protein [Pseudoduganella lutea]
MYNAGASRTSGAHRSCQKDPVPHRDLPHPRLEIDRQRAEFADAAVEDRFNRHHLPERSAQLKISLLFCAAFYVAFGATDVATLGPTTTAGVMIALRVLVALIAGAGLLAITRRPESVRVAVLAACNVEIVGLAVFMVLCWYQPAAMTWNVMSQALILMAIYVNIPNRFIYAVWIACGSSAVFCVMLFVQGSLRMDDQVALVLLLMLGNTLGYIGARRFHLAQREQFRSAILLEQLADRDPLTGCFNRRVLQRGLLDAELARARRYGTALSVILCDIDHFKRINDTHGHAAGDHVLHEFGGLLLAMTRETVDSVVRYGGEEFLMVLPETDLDGAHALAERIRHAFGSTGSAVELGQFVTATASFGIAAVPALDPDAPDRPDMLVEAADAQLYAAKRGGRNCVRGVAVTAAPVRSTA